MKVLYSEGVATHTGPEPCVVVRKGEGEASAGERIGQPLSRERSLNPSSRRRAKSGRRQGGARHRERLGPSARSETLACADAPCLGTGRPCIRPFVLSRAVRVGKARSRSR